MAETKIEWTATQLPDGSLLPGYSFNPWIGCQAVSPACAHCYAEALVKRYGGDFSVRRRTAPANWKKPLKWNRDAERDGIRRKVFCASMADVFDNQVPAEWRRDLFDLIHRTPHLDWLLLTKRPQNIAKMLPLKPVGPWDVVEWGDGWPNVWLGCTAENQEEADRRIPHLLAVPAAVRFLSCEPLLGPIAFGPYTLTARPCFVCQAADSLHEPRSDYSHPINCGWRHDNGNEDAKIRHGIDWVFAGNESGPGRRRGNLDHMRSLRDQCAVAGVPFFGKQDDKVHELPDDLKVRQFPHEAVHA